MAVVWATLGLNERDGEEKGMEKTEIQQTWTGGDLPEREM